MTSEADEVIFFTHADLCAAMKVCNLVLRKWIVTTKPEIVHNYIKFNDKNPFDPILLNCALLQDTNAPFPYNLARNLTGLVTYKTIHVDDNDRSVSLSFVVGRYFAVNGIIFKPTINTWKYIVNFDYDYLI